MGCRPTQVSDMIQAWLQVCVPGSVNYPTIVSLQGQNAQLLFWFCDILFVQKCKEMGREVMEESREKRRRFVAPRRGGAWKRNIPRVSPTLALLGPSEAADGV